MSAKTNLRSFNLNTLPVLREILRHGSVSKAAIALNVSQPALSGALKQLRHHFGDELIVRSKGTMKLTAKAEAILAPLEKALSAVQQLIMPDDESPSAPPAVFKISTNDHVMNMFAGPLTQLLMQEKKNILPHFLSVGQHTIEQLFSGGTDCIIVSKRALVAGYASSRELDTINSEPLFSEELVGIGRRSDRELAHGLSLEDYLNRPHVSFTIDPDRNLTVEPAYLAGNSLKQNDMARFSNYLPIPGIVASTGCIAIIPASLAYSSSEYFDLQIFSPPIAFPPVEWALIWHRRNDQIDRHVQFRTIIKSCALHVDESIKLIVDRSV
jgi:DNA-binding transcriptional LysR family regulator